MAAANGSMTLSKRVLEVTAGNLRQNHIYIRGNYDFFPRDCIGPARRSQRGCGTIEIQLAGLNQTVTTDIGCDAKTGKPRGFFRSRRWVRLFFEHHRLKVGARLSLERLSERRYRLSVEAGQQPGNSLDFAEFFAGIGLVRLALESQGWRAVFANDIDPKKAEIYRHNWPYVNDLHIGDIHAISADEIPECTLFTASFPCNDLSIAGRWEGLHGKESSSFWGLVRVLREIGSRRPQFIILENVIGFLLSRGGRDLEQALLALNELDYAVDAVVLDAIRWVPQSRPRLFVVAQRDAGHVRRECALMSEARPASLFKFIAGHPNIRWNIRDLPRLPERQKTLADIVENLADEDPHWWNEQRAEYFMNQMSPKHSAQARAMVAGKVYTYATAFRRVRYGKSMA
ncbi:MAG: DNA cytosine methyltransferase, partial [Pirellulales bacterium]